MHDEQLPDWQVALANLRARPRPLTSMPTVSEDISSEALMTIVAIMKDNDDPKLQMAAAKMVLEKSAKLPSVIQANMPPMKHSEPEHLTADDIDAAIVLAKALLDQMAATKTQELDGKGEVVAQRTSGTDNPAG